MIGIAIIGATGSIGKQVLEIVTKHPKKFSLRALTAFSKIKELEKLAIKFKPHAIWHAGLDSHILSDIFIDPKTDLIIIGVSGHASFKYYRLALECGKDIAIASKEAIIIGGREFLNEAAARKQRIIPLDSEIIGLELLLKSFESQSVASISITGSGGPFLNFREKDLNRVRPEQACCHPRWQMGPKISVESALWINKGYELLEAHIFFGIPLDKINVLIHPESYVHALISLNNGALISQIAINNMNLPLSLALSDYSGFEISSFLPDFDLINKQLSFFSPNDFFLFKGIELVLSAYKMGIISEFISKTDNLISKFLAAEILFTDIYKELHQFLQSH